MPLVAGQTLSFYEILGPLGAGGMGEVYRAKDTRLERQVAIKVLPEELACDEERLRRFEREAKTLASLNHPNVAGIHGVDQEGDVCFLALELVPGEDLATRLSRGALPIEESIEVCRQIAEGLEAAHEAGVVHRDLKPANVRITPEGVVKILDFGLAKQVRPKTTAEGTSSAESDSSFLTEEGLVLGTPKYMSPEQARGKAVDRRTDIWAFGCVMYECLTVERAFEGETLSDVIAAILDREPDWSRVPVGVGADVLGLLHRCLTKDPRTRLRDIGEARIVLDRAPQAESATSDEAASRRRFRPTALLAAFAMGLGAMYVVHEITTTPAPPNPLDDAEITKVTDSEWTEFGATISRDGKFIAFASNSEGPFDAWVRQLGTWENVNLTQGRKDWWGSVVRDLGFTPDGTRVWVLGTQTEPNVSFTILGSDRRTHFGPTDYETVWSPDGTRVVYHTGADGDPLYLAEADGAHPVVIARHDHGMHQHFPIWSPKGRWIYVVRGLPTTGEMDLWRVRPEENGEFQRLTTGMVDVSFPTPIDERIVLFLARTETGAGPWIWALDVETGDLNRQLAGVEQYTSLGASGDGRRLVATVSNPRATLMRVPIFTDRAATQADVELVPGLESVPASHPRLGGGDIYFVSSQGLGDGLWCLRDGRPVEILRGSEVAVVASPSISPDGERVAVVLRRKGEIGLWLFDSAGQNPRLLSEGTKVYGEPEWAPDGSGVAVGGTDEQGPALFFFPEDGGRRERLVDGFAISPVWSPNGDRVAYLGPTIMAFHEISALNLHSGEVIDVPDDLRVRVGEPMRFLPDGRSLVFMSGALPARDFYVFDLDAENLVARRLTDLRSSALTTSFDIDPAGKHIVFDHIEQNSDVVLIELADLD